MRRHPFTDLDHPDTTIKRKNFVAKKPFMHQIYLEWYQILEQHLPESRDVLVELGSGPGFMNEIIPSVISTDILFLPYIDLVLNGLHLPFANKQTDGILMMNVFHHIPNVEDLLGEANRVLRVGGRMILIEPWMNGWSKWIYTRFHHEMTDTSAAEWAFQTSGPLSGANQALPWMVFERDLEIFTLRFSDLVLKEKQAIMPLAYLLGGGFSLRTSMPGFMYPVIRRIENTLFNHTKSGMFALIVLEKIK